MATQPKDYYRLLGVSRDATPEEIKRAYRRLARQLHPDVNPDPAAQERFREITVAYEVLSDPAKREVVDLGGDPLAAAGGVGGAGSPFNMGFQDIMDAFFGTTVRGPRTRVRQGSDALIPLELDLAETAFGTLREVPVETAVLCSLCEGAGTAPGTHSSTCQMCGGRGEVQTVQRSFLGQVMMARPCAACGGFGTVIDHPCPHCGGDGRVRTRRTISVRIPAGVEDRMQIRLSGEGEVGSGGGPAGDLYVEIHERPHELFTRDGVDLHCRVAVPMTAAALGTQVVLPTLDGSEVSVDVRPGTQSGTVVTLRGLGVPHLRGGVRGDLLVHIDVRTPGRLDQEQEDLLRRLAELRGEERPEPLRSAGATGLFSRMRDAWSGR